LTAHAHLVHLFEGKLGPSSRIVFVGSALHKGIKTLQQMEQVLLGRTPYNAKLSYSATKLLQLLYAQRFRTTLPCQVVVISPGFIPSTALGRELSWIEQTGMWYVLPWLPFARTAEQGASPSHIESPTHIEQADNR
jgi:hypothetical protein